MPAKRKHHEIIQNIEHKHCGSCKKWVVVDQFGKNVRAWDGRQSCCKRCRRMNEKQYHEETNKVALEKREKARKEAPAGVLVCLFVGCTIKDWLQPMDQFMNLHVHTHEVTKGCLTCRDKEKVKKKQRYTACQRVYNDWRKIHPCVKCMNDSNYKHNYLLIEADHIPELGKKMKRCSNFGYWATKSRGPLALKAELMKCQALCRFHHRLQTQQRRHDNGKIEKNTCKLRKRAVINKEKHKRECCLLCEQPVKEGEECGFDFDHRNSKTKFKYNGKTIGPSAFVGLPQSLFDTQWPLEQAKCDLLCVNCHGSKTNVSRDGYKK